MSFRFACNLLCPTTLLLISPFLLAQNEISRISVENVRHALATEHDAIARDPNNPENYIHLAGTLLDAGIVDQARQQAANAVAVAPKSASGYNALGVILDHNSVGAYLGPGFDYDASVDAYRKAIELAPKDMSIRQNLAMLLEYNRDGIRYAPDSHLAEAIEILHYIKAHQTSGFAIQITPSIKPLHAQPAPEIEDHLLFDLFYAGRFKEIRDNSSKLSSPSIYASSITIAAIAAADGPAAAITFSDGISKYDQNKKNALTIAAHALWDSRRYSQATALLTASLPDPVNSATILGRIQILRNLKPYPGATLPATDPRSPVEQLMFAMVTGSITEDIFGHTLSGNAYANKADRSVYLQHADEFNTKFLATSRQIGLTPVVMQDTMLGSMAQTIVPSAEPGSRVLLHLAGAPPMHFFVINEDGIYKIVGNDKDTNNIAAEAIYLLHHNQQAMAASLLNWKRETAKKDRDDDPLGGLLFTRLWKGRTDQSPQAIELAAAALSSDPAVLTAILPHAISARQAARTDAERDNLDLLLATIYLHTSDGPNATSAAQQLLARYPDSVTAVTLAGRVYAFTHDWAAWKSLTQAQLQAHPGDRSLLVQSAREAENEGDYTRARQAFRTILDSGNAVAGDYNNFAWLSLFEGKVDDQAIAASEQANLMTKNSNHAYLHTLACLNATRGKVPEARQLLEQAVTAGRFQELDSALWFGFGLIYEQYGVNDAAIAAYKRVEKTEKTTINATAIDSYLLAQRHLKSLAAAN